MNPYEVLGLAEDESDERTIKRAYAKLLRQHRPDQDPEGFTRIHQAYQWIVSRSQGASTPTRPVLAVSNASPPSVANADPPEIPQPIVAETPLDSACARLVEAASLPLGIEREEAISSAIAQLSEVATESDDLTRARRHVESVVRGQPRRWGVASANKIILLAEGSPWLIEELLLHHLKSHSLDAVLTLLKAWIEAAEKPDRRWCEESTLIKRVVRWCVFVDYDLARRLVSMLVHHEGMHAAGGCDVILSAGYAAKSFPPELLPRLAAVTSGVDRSRSTAVRELGVYVKALPHDHPVRRLLAVQVPSLVRVSSGSDLAAEAEANGLGGITGIFISVGMALGFFICQGLFGGPSFPVYFGGVVLFALIFRGVVWLVRG